MRIKILLLTISFLVYFTGNLFAAILNFVGWEIGDSSEATSTAGTFSVQSTVKRTGGYALQVNPTTTNIGTQTFSIIEANGTNGDGSPTIGNTIYVRFYFRYATKPTSGDEEIFTVLSGTSATQKMSLRLDDDGTLNAYNTNAGALIGSSTAALSQDTWYRIEVLCQTSSSTADVEVLVDGNSEIFNANVNTNGTGCGRVLLGKQIDRNSNTIDVFYDDLSISTTGYPGAGQISKLSPNANGATMEWTSGTGASDYTQVDETPRNFADYVMSTTAGGDIALFALESSATGGISGTIAAVKAVTTGRENTTVTSATSVRVVSGGTTVDTTAFNGTTSTHTLSSLVMETDPDTAAAWTTTGIDALEVGQVEANAVNKICDSVYLMVDYVPAAAPASSTSNFFLVL